MRGYLLETGRNHPGRVMWVGDGMCGMTPFRDRATVFSSKKKAQPVIAKFSINYGLTIVPADARRKTQ